MLRKGKLIVLSPFAKKTKIITMAINFQDNLKLKQNLKVCRVQKK